MLGHALSIFLSLPLLLAIFSSAVLAQTESVDYWRTDVTGAQDISRSESRLLLVLVTDDDFADPTAGPVALLFQQAMESHPTAHAALVRRTVGVRRPQGAPQRLFTIRQQGSTIARGSLMVALCDPELRTLRVVVGLPTPQRMLQLLDESEADYLAATLADATTATKRQAEEAQFRLEPFWRQQTQLLRQKYPALTPENIERPAAQAALTGYLQDLNTFHLQDLVRRLQLSSEDVDQLPARLDQHGTTREAFVDALLVGAPRTPWPILESSLAEVLWKQPRWQSVKIDPLLETCRQGHVQGKPIVLQVRDTRLPLPAPLGSSAPALALQKQLESSEVVQVNLTEVAQVGQTLDWPATHAYQPAPLRWILIDPNTKAPEYFHEQMPLSALQRALARAARDTKR